MSAIIEVDNLSFGYTPQSMILKDISFNVKSGTFLAIAGPNGAGKSTLLNLMCGILKPSSGLPRARSRGTIRIDSKSIESYKTETLAKKVAVVRQDNIDVFGFSVIETVLMARTPYFNTVGFESKADRHIVNEALQATDTAQFALRPLGNLSGGERQRVFIARALAQNTPILLLDEPTSFLDLKHQVKIYDLLKSAQLEKGKTIIAVTHDINLAAQYCDEILLLKKHTISSTELRNNKQACPEPAERVDQNYYIGKTKDIFTPEQVEKVFGVRTFAGTVGQEKFFIPLGKLAKDTAKINSRPNSSPSK
jgi:iron complex transport system ATP-binding protein